MKDKNIDYFDLETLACSETPNIAGVTAIWTGGIEAGKTTETMTVLFRRFPRRTGLGTASFF